MKVDYISDLHIDQNAYGYTYDNKPINVRIDSFIDNLCELRNSDIIVIAGDIANDNVQTKSTLRSLRRYYKHVIFVPGNHDHWIIRKSFNTSEDRIRELVKSNTDTGVHILYGNTIEIDGIVFGGSTGWNDFRYGIEVLGEDEKFVKKLWQHSWVDSKYCVGVDCESMNSEQNKILTNIAKKSDVIITHFCPYSGSAYIPERWRDDVYTSFFYFNNEMIIENNERVKTWIFGHTHDVVDYEYKGIRYVCNPHGYRTELLENVNIGRLRTIDIHTVKEVINE